MCKYCEREETIFEEDYINDNMAYWETEKTAKDYCLDKNNTCTNIVFIDTRGFLRFADKEDNQCLDHGQYIKIEFCPFCGGKLSHD